LSIQIYSKEHFDYLVNMKNTIILFLSLFILSNTGMAQEINIPTEHKKTVQLFLDGANLHSNTKILKSMDKVYKKEQIKFLGGNTQQFIDELFGGEDLITHKYVNQSFDKLQKVELYSIIKDKQGNYKYIFRSQDGQSDILFTLFLTKRGKKYGFEGARG